MTKFAVVGAISAVAAGCSSDSSRFAGSFFGGTDPEYTGSLPPTPTQPVSASPLGDPRGQAAYGQLGSMPAGGGDGTAVIVGPNETIQTISARYGVPANALMSVNGISDANAVQPGQQLVIPVYSQAANGWVRPEQASTGVKVAGPAPVSAAAVAPSRPAAKPASSGGVHTVAPGETVYSLGRLYNVRPNDIIAANNMQAPYGIRIGQKVTIPGVTVAKTAPKPAAAPVQQAESSDAEPVAAPQKVAAAPAPAPAKTGIQSETLPAPKQVAYAPQNDTASGTDNRAGVPEPAALSAGNFRWPVRGRIISSYGEKNDGGTNDGINVSVPEGTSVRSAENGVVAYAGNELKGYGNLVLIRHADEWVTAYAHNSELLVKRGDVVSRGQVIAKAGQTGSVSTPQMHFELRKGSQPVDPLKHLASD